MVYVLPTAAQFKTAKPQFEAVADPTVEMHIQLASRVVDTSWLEPDYQPAVIAYTCHLMTLEGLGTDPISQSHANGSAEYQSIKSGELTLTRFKSSVPATTSYADWLSSTPCGRFYAMLLRMNRGGPLAVSIASPSRVSPYAKDVGRYGWPGVFL